MRRACLLGFSVLVCGALFGACKEADSSTVAPAASSGAGGTVLDLSLGGGGGAEAGAPAEQNGVEECQSLAGLDQCGLTSVEATFSAANVLLVIDKSSSMDDQP